MNFPESLDYLYSLGYELSVRKFGLENTFILLKALKNPEKNYLKIQIAGTNGKGSTCAFLDSICSAANIKTGLYTSPHLISITERIKLSGAEISEKDFARHATLVREVSEKLVETGELPSLPTFFEQVTAIALNYFAEQKIEIAILETGIGGRFDSTTATNAEIVGITPIDYDHQNVLGETLTEIASEKAAIIRSGTHVFVAPQKKEAEKVIYGKCRETGVEPVWATPNVKLIEDLGSDLLFLSFQTKQTNYKTEFWMRGRHQWTNAALAIYIAESLPDFGFKIVRENIITGVENTRHKGRLEFYKGILFDGAHNVAGAKALKEYLEDSVKKSVIMIFGAMQDKDLSEIAEILFSKADRLILTKPDYPRAAETSELQKIVSSSFNKEKIIVAETVAEALEKAREMASENDLILVTGSLYLVGEAQKILKQQTEI